MGFGAKGAVGDPKPQMFKWGAGGEVTLTMRHTSVANSEGPKLETGFGAKGAVGGPKPHMSNQGAR
jgi:hypothetical protein